MAEKTKKPKSTMSVVSKLTHSIKRTAFGIVKLAGPLVIGIAGLTLAYPAYVATRGVLQGSPPDAAGTASATLGVAKDALILGGIGYLVYEGGKSLR